MGIIPHANNHIDAALERQRQRDREAIAQSIRIRNQMEAEDAVRQMVQARRLMEIDQLLLDPIPKELFDSLMVEKAKLEGRWRDTSTHRLSPWKKFVRWVESWLEYFEYYSEKDETT